MRSKYYWQFYLASLIVVIAASVYSIYMSVQVVRELYRSGVVSVESYPKYIIPYVPISIAIFAGVLLMPVFQQLTKKYDLLFGSIVSTGIFLAAEKLMETNILVQAEEMVSLESWQMSLCYVPPEQYQTRTWQAVDVLLGGYTPAFKLHFYLISVVLVISLLNCFYGFAKMIRLGNFTRKPALIIQTVASIFFLGMCIWACFTSFYRSGEITVTAVSALLMAVFFILLAVTVGIFVGSLTLGKAGRLSILLPSVLSTVTALVMYLGEAILLNGNLYRFGSGFLFEEMGTLVIAPVDLIIILISGGITALICRFVNAPLHHIGESEKRS